MSDSATPEGTASDALKSVSDALEKAVQTASDTALDAKASVERAFPEATRFVASVVYSTSYAISYGLVFPEALIARSIPSNNALVNGLVDGAKAAIDTIDHMKKR